MNEPLKIWATDEDLYLVVNYMEEKLRTDIARGMQIEPEKLHRMLQALYELKRAALAIDPAYIRPPDDGCVIGSRNAHGG